MTRAKSWREELLFKSRKASLFSFMVSQLALTWKAG